MVNLIRSQSCPLFSPVMPDCYEIFRKSSMNINTAVGYVWNLNSAIDASLNTSRECEFTHLKSLLKNCFIKDRISNQDSLEYECSDIMNLQKLNCWKEAEKKIFERLQEKNSYYNKSLLGFDLCYMYLNQSKFAQVALVAEFFIKMAIPHTEGQFLWMLTLAWMSEHKYIEVIKEASLYLIHIEHSDPYRELIKDEIRKAKQVVQIRYGEAERKINKAAQSLSPPSYKSESPSRSSSDECSASSQKEIESKLPDPFHLTEFLNQLNFSYVMRKNENEGTNPTEQNSIKLLTESNTPPLEEDELLEECKKKITEKSRLSAKFILATQLLKEFREYEESNGALQLGENFLSFIEYGNSNDQIRFCEDYFETLNRLAADQTTNHTYADKLTESAMRLLELNINFESKIICGFFLAQSFKQVGKIEHCLKTAKFFLGLCPKVKFEHHRDRLIKLIHEAEK